MYFLIYASLVFHRLGKHQSLLSKSSALMYSLEFRLSKSGTWKMVLKCLSMDVLTENLQLPAWHLTPAEGGFYS